jgi:hypothetical protein
MNDETQEEVANFRQADEEMELNRAAWDRLQDSIRRDYAGRYVGMAYGRVMASGPDFDEVQAAMEAIDPPPYFMVVFPADDGPRFDFPESRYIEILDG